MKIINVITTLSAAILFCALSLFCALGEKSEFSESERRRLAEKPEISLESVLSGEFASDFEAYSVDHFPLRDRFRSIKAYTRLFLLGQKENNSLYSKSGHLAKLEYPMNESMLSHAAKLIQKVRGKYLTDQNVYFAMIPDKNKYLGDLTIDYDLLTSQMMEKMPGVTPIEISSLLEADDYYRTDTHWRQDKIIDVAKMLANQMGASISEKYEQKVLEEPFYGVYTGQAALHVEPDTIYYLTNPVISSYQVSGAAAVYDLAKAKGNDPYEMFLSGNQPLVTIKNPANTSGSRLIVFRDSFGSAIAPLLAEGYSEVVLVDLRYLASDFVGNFVNFENADVLFLYSTLLLNSSLGMK